MTPEEYIRRKKTYPVALTSDQVDAMSQQFREASAWIVGIEEAYIIEAYYAAAHRIASGELSGPEAARAVREVLASAGYRADKPRSWTDLSHGTARQRLILDTNVKKAASYAWHESIKGSHAYPAQRLVRMGTRRQPRDWQARWRQAYAALPPEEQRHAHPTDMVATTGCAIWRALSRWGDPYPPFDYGSGMDVMPVDRDTASALGILGGGEPTTTPSGYGPMRELPDDLLPDVRVQIEGWIADCLH